jgi:hypothetical protein
MAGEILLADLPVQYDMSDDDLAQHASGIRLAHARNVGDAFQTE